MSVLRETLDDPPRPGPVDVARLKELSAIADAKAFDPRTPTYNPADHAPPRRERQPPTAGLDSPVLLNLSARVHAASAERFQPTVGGTTERPSPSDVGREDDRGSEVPCAEQRPRWTYALYGSEASLTETHVAATDEAGERVAEVLDDAGEELTAEDVQEALQYVNPTGSNTNCVEAAKAVDDILGGRPAVAGPTPRQPLSFLEAALSPRTVDYREELTAGEIERIVADGGPGARGVVIGWQHHNRMHAYNVANIGGEVYWLDGQMDLMSEHDPHGHWTFDLYQTGSEGEQ